MKVESFNSELHYTDDRINTQLVLETTFSKEIRILLKEGQIMKEHKAPYPIIVHVIQGAIEFGVNGDHHQLVEGDIITLDANVPHDLKANKNSAVRLTLAKGDSINRVDSVVSH